MQDGSMEIMIHRRLLYDDAFGVGEPLNESAYGQGKDYGTKTTVFFIEANSGAKDLQKVLKSYSLESFYVYFFSVCHVILLYYLRTYLETI